MYVMEVDFVTVSTKFAIGFCQFIWLHVRLIENQAIYINCI
jgi:hypothetical protein